MGPSLGRARFLPYAVAGSAALVLGCVASAPPGENALLPPCPFKVATGLDCPGCGTGRALYQLTRGDVLTAIDHNVLAMVALPLMVWAWLAWVAPGRVPAWRLPAPLVRLLPVVIIGYWIVRNLPMAPFTSLASSA